MADVEKALDDAGLKNPHVREYVQYWAELTGAERVEVVSAADDARLIQEALDAGELEPAGEGLYYSRSYSKDTARSEERTIVATSDPADKGVYNNWRPAAEMKPLLEERMRGASAGKTMYVVPYLMAPPGSPLERYAAGVELTDTRTVVLHMIRMARVGVDHIDNLADPNSFVRAVHVTGDLENLGQGTADDQRYFVTVADERTILHFGSSYGGNALLGKIAHGLRQAAYDGWASGEFLAEQFMLIGITDKQTGQHVPHLRRLPERVGQDQPGDDAGRPTTSATATTSTFYGDDIAWLWVDPKDGKLYGDEPRVRGVRRRQGHQREHQPDRAARRSAEGTGAIFTNVAYNEKTHEVWWEGKTPEPPADVTGWRDWKGELDRRARRPASGRAVGAPEQPVHHHAGQRARTSRPTSRTRKGVPIDAIIFGGRTRDREPLIRAITDLAEGVYDGLTLGAEATFAAEGVEGQLRYDPMSMRPFMSYPEGALRRALAQDHRRREATSRSSRTSTGSSATPRTATSCGRATATTCARCCG